MLPPAIPAPLAVPPNLGADATAACDTDALGSALRREMTPGEALLMRTADIAVGEFHGAPADAWFGGSGPLQLHYIVFPLSTVEIRHRGRAPFIASPVTLSLLAPGDRYARRAVAPQGDRAIYVALTAPALRRCASDAAPDLLDASAGGTECSGPAGLAAPLLLAARRFAADLRAERVASAFEAEERVADLLRRVLGDVAVQRRARRDRPPPRAREAQLRRVERAKEYLALHYDGRVTLDELGRVAATAPCHLARLFRLHTGFSAHEYLTRVRLAHALDLLQRGPGSLSDIALQLGFSHHSHFSARFRSVFGLTPSAYLRSATAASGAALRGALTRQGIQA